MSINYSRQLFLVIVASVLFTGVSPQSYAKDVKADNSSVKLQSRKRGINANLVDQGDYYYHPDGRKIRYLRKQDVFAVKVQGRHAKRAMARMKATYGDQIEPLNRHELGAMMVVKVKPTTSNRNSKSTRQAAITGAMLKSLDRSISQVRPIFANDRGQGDIVLLPKLTVKFKRRLGDGAMAAMLQRFGLQIDRKLRLSGQVYSLTINNRDISEAQQFALVRSIMNHRWVKWAEPQFASKPYKTSFEPSDEFFAEQWHLRNVGESGALCDSDCDANNAWDINADGVSGGDQGVGAVAGDGMVIAIIDDGVQLDHEDLNIWVNAGETPNNSIDDDGNGFVDDINGWDFVNDPNTSLQNPDLEGAGTCVGGDDGVAGPDNDPSPQAFTNCFKIEGDPVEQDNHGTAVAGLAAAIGTNSVGVVGTAFRAQILPIRLVSDFDNSDTSSFCTKAAEAMAYAGRYADVINNSWGMDDTCVALEDTIADVVAGSVLDSGNDSEATVFKRPGLGSPVMFASGNDASGWIKVTVPVSVGEHAYEWRFLRSAFPATFDPSASYTLDEDNTAWLDDITWPDNSGESFESGTGGLSAFTSDLALNQSCDVNCTSFLFPGRPEWEIETDANHVLSGSQSARVDASNSDCGNVYLHTLRDESSAGELSFWVWVSTNTQAGSDKFEFLLDGKEVVSFGDISKFVDNAVGYPARLATTVAVGASDSGDLSGDSGSGLSNLDRRAQEKRAWYTQYGPELDFLVPSGNQHLGITTTDRSGVGEGYNSGANTADYSDTAYTNTFGGTSAAAPAAAGVAAAVIAIDSDLTAGEVRDVLNNSADKIGGATYDNGGNGRNDFYGFGRLNMLKALQAAASITETDPAGSCSQESFTYSPAVDRVLGSFVPGAFCPAQGPVPQSDELCVPIKAPNGAIALICL